MLNNQRGFGISAILLISVVVMLVCGTGFYVFSRNDSDKDGANSPLSTRKTDTTEEFMGTKIIYKADLEISSDEKKQIQDRMINPLLYHYSVVSGGNIKTLTLSNANDQVYKYEINAGDYSFWFGQDNKIEYFYPQLCDDGGCSEYPETLKSKYPESYEAYVTCAQEDEKNISLDERDVICKDL